MSLSVFTSSARLMIGRSATDAVMFESPVGLRNNRAMREAHYTSNRWKRQPCQAISVIFHFEIYRSGGLLDTVKANNLPF
jgi:hypothetical protein